VTVVLVLVDLMRRNPAVAVIHRRPLRHKETMAALLLVVLLEVIFLVAVVEGQAQ
jgi:hypothetical protein